MYCLFAITTQEREIFTSLVEIELKLNVEFIYLLEFRF